MTEDKDEDFLDELVRESTAKNPEFPKLVDEALKKRQHERGSKEGGRRKEPPQPFPLIYNEKSEPIGYRLKDIRGSLTGGDLARWDSWFEGQTGVLIDGELVVYPWDWVRFARDLDPFD